MGPEPNTTEERPSNPMAGLSDSWEGTREDRTRLERLIEVVTTLHEPTRVSAVAKKADCSANFAGDKLELLAGLGIVEKVADNPAEYRRDELHFRRLHTRNLIAEYDGDVESAIEDYRNRDQEFKDRFGVDSPAAVTWEHLDETDVPDELAETRRAISTWVVVRRRLMDLQRAATVDFATSESSDPFGTLADLDEFVGEPVETEF